jgi:cyclic dehypoxanthinyl futalosine synthase
VKAAIAKIEQGGRVSTAEALRLYENAELVELSRLADMVRWRLHPEPVVTYIRGRNINYTNVCWVRCRFCNFSCAPASPDAYVLTKEQIFQKIEELVALGGTELLMQGGLNPQLKLDYFEDLFSSIRERFPTTHLHALSVSEVRYIAHMARLSVKETLARLRDAGLASLPGAGGEILVDRVRGEIAPRKDTADEWLGVMRDAHEIGMRTTATMMYGSVETLAERIEHLQRVRDLQDETGGFTAFIPWSYQPDGTELGGKKTGGYEYLRTVAISRIFLDNVPSIQASWVTQGAKIGAISLGYGVNDFGSTMLEENVVSSAGTSYDMPISEIERIIRDAGYEPRRRDTLYSQV